MAPRIVERLAELQELLGQKIGECGWFEVSQSLINQFAELTHDRQWIHVDPERARTESPYGTTIALGFLTTSLLSYLHGQIIRVQGDYTRMINYGFNRLRFPAPVLAGAQIRVSSRLQTIEEIAGGVQCTWDVSVEIQGQPKPALVAEWLTRLYR